MSKVRINKDRLKQMINAVGALTCLGTAMFVFQTILMHVFGGGLGTVIALISVVVLLTIGSSLEEVEDEKEGIE